MSGYRSVAFWLGLSGSATQAGFRTPLPFWNAGAAVDVGQGGFRTPLPGWNAGATAEIVVEVPPKTTPGPVSAPGGGFVPYRSPTGPRRDIDEWEDDEEEIIIAICAAFLEIVE